MLLDEFFPDGPDTSVKSESNAKNSKISHDNIDSDEEVKNVSDSSEDSRTEFANDVSDRGLTKTILPDNLQELVKEAHAELNPETH